jgi:hypothetical protein
MNNDDNLETITSGLEVLAENVSWPLYYLDSYEPEKLLAVLEMIEVQLETVLAAVKSAKMNV